MTPKQNVLGGDEGRGPRRIVVTPRADVNPPRIHASGRPGFNNAPVVRPVPGGAARVGPPVVAAPAPPANMNGASASRRNHYLLISLGVSAALLMVLSFTYTSTRNADESQAVGQPEQTARNESPGGGEREELQGAGGQNVDAQAAQGGEATAAEAPAESANATAPAAPAPALEPSAGEVSNVPPVDSSAATTILSNATSLASPAAVAAGHGGPDLASIESAAVQVMRRISHDGKTYSFDEKTLQDISLRIEELKGSGQLQDSLKAMQSGLSPLTAQARREGLEPRLVVYASLAMGYDGKVGGDPVRAANSILSPLSSLNKVLGSSGADSSLILLAALSEGGGSKRSHPLLGRIRQLVRDPLGERNVWFLHKQGVINDRAYGLVINFLALGIIAENPRQYGLDADALAF